MDPTNRNTALASAFVEELARCGVRHAALAPGSRSTPLALALWRQPEIETSVHIDERCAGFFALGAAQLGVPTVVLCTSGTAAAHLHPAVAEADEAALPMIVLTADRPPELRGIGAGQTIDQLKLYGAAVRWFCEVGTHEADDDGLLHYRSVACRAFALAAGDPRPGPVHLNLAWREPLAPRSEPDAVEATSPLALEGRGSEPLTSVANPTPAPTPELIEELAAEIEARGRGLIVCGRQTNGRLAPLVAELARAVGYPILAEPTSQLRLGDHDRSMVVGGYDAITRSRPTALEPELVIRFGGMPTSKSLRLWLLEIEPRQFVFDPAHGWNEPSRRAVSMVRADPAQLAVGLSSRVKVARQGVWTSDWLDADRAVGEAFRAELEDTSELSEPGVHAALGRAHRDGDLVYTASSMPIRDQEEFLESSAKNVLFLCNRGANGIDGLVSSGIGAAAASGRPTTIVLGDLALVHDLGGLLGLRQVDSPVRIVVIDNGGGGIFHFLPQAELLDDDEFEALLGTPSGIEPWQAASLFGLEHRPIVDLGELPGALEAGTGLISVKVDRRANVAVHERLRAAAHKALREL
ncbi:MAG: 2-succinyl-5-enolpyruvyl-6-hydroxy-3-cyclohexene-1-carboxylic-acid synthase [Solirubrobacterales bacterium]